MRLGILFFLTWALPGLALEYTRINCDDNFRNITWPHLTVNEPALRESYNMMVVHSGSTKVTNCVVDYPVVGGQPVDGPRRVILDVQWFSIRYVDGKEVRIFRQEGLRADYVLGQGFSGKTREVTGFSVCRTPEACRSMSIPFGEGAPPLPTPAPGPTPPTTY